MYVSTSYNKVVALNPDTGEVLWTYDPRITEWGQVPNGTGFVHRGVALWENDTGDRRVFLNSRWRLISIDTVTGEPDPSFGDGGRDRPHGAAPLAHQPPPLHPDLAAGRLRGPGDHGERRLGPVRLRARPAGERAGVQHPDRRAGLVLQPDPAARRVRKRHLGGRRLGPGGAHERLGADVPRRRARTRLPPRRDAEQRLLRRPPPRRQPLRGGHRLPRRAHRRARLALPDREARPLGLRPAGRARPC